MALIGGIKLPRGDGKGTFNPPMFSHTYDLTTAQEKNAKGTWNGYVIAKGFLLETTTPSFMEAVAFYQQLHEGDVKVDYAAQQGDPDEDTEVPMQ